MYKHCIKNRTVSKHNYEFTVCPLTHNPFPSTSRVCRRGPAVQVLYCDLSPKLLEDRGKE